MSLRRIPASAHVMLGERRPWTTRANATFRRSALATAVGVALTTLLVACGSQSGDGSGAAPAAFNPRAIVMHNDASDVQLKGDFSRFSGYLSESRQSLQAPPGGRASASFPLPAVDAGFYEIFVSWPQTGPQGSRARVVVADSEGSSSLIVDQRPGDGGQWNSVGVHALGASGGRITLEQIDGSPMLVDAIRVQYAGAERPALALASAQLDVGHLDEPYAARVQPAGGKLPYQYTVDQSALPPGLTFNTATGAVEGRPAVAGEYTFPVEISDAAGSRQVFSVQLQVVESSTPIAPNLKASTSDSLNVSASGVAKAASAEPLNFSVASKSASSGGASTLLPVIQSMDPGTWLKLNLNHYSDAWAPPALRPLINNGNPTPASIIEAWSSFAWDSNRGDLWLFGGGHANYRGNDVYVWRGATRKWERASLSSESVTVWPSVRNAIDGHSNAPASAHTYDNNIFLPKADRLLVLGGAADPNGGHFFTVDAAGTGTRPTGPYLFDPNRAHPNRVGGTTGSHVKREGAFPEIVGGNMWSNREAWLTAALKPSTGNFVDGCTAYAEENGKDVVYTYRVANGVWRYAMPDVSRPELDTWERVGRYWGGPGSQTACGYDPVGKSLVRVATNATPFVYWDLNKAGPTNNDILMVPTDPTGEFAAALANNEFQMRNCGLDFDNARGNYALWCGGGRVWMLTPSPGLTASGWTIRRQPTPSGSVPPGAVGVGIMGKWKYVAELDAYLALENFTYGNVWVYKPMGWTGGGGGGGGGGGTTPPPNVAPQVSLQSPIQGASFAVGSPIGLSAQATDSDGSVTRVDFFASGALVGSATSAPWTALWSGAAAASYTLTAVATDNAGAQTTSVPVGISVVQSGGGGSSGTVVLQQGRNGYQGTSDTYLSTYHKSLSFGTATLIQDQGSYYSDLVRFAIFQAEGGPVPDRATILSAKLGLYKYTPYDMSYALHPVLKAWNENTANWNVTGTGLSWTAPGASAAGSDYAAVADATTTASWDGNEWVEFDVKDGVQRMANQGANHGWRLIGTAGYRSGLKRFYTSNYGIDPALRPKLTIEYR